MNSQQNHHIEDLYGLSNFDLSQSSPLLTHLGQFEEIIQYRFQNKELLLEALCHPSFINESQGLNLSSNQRLEFLGDAVLGQIVSHDLYLRFQNEEEGVLSKLKAACVNEVSLFQMAKTFDLSKYVLVGKGEREGVDQSLSILSDCFEAILGAIFLDSNHHTVADIFHSLLNRYEKESSDEFYSLTRLKFFDPKSTLQEFCLKRYQTLPIYRDREVGEQLFQVELLINDEVVGVVQMNSKKKAQKYLAQQYLTNLKEETLC